MKPYILHKDNFIKEELTIHYVVDISNYISDIQLLIDYFNSEYKWDGMFDIDECENRIELGHYLFLLKLNHAPIGYVWFKELSNDVCFGYNLYVTKQISRPKYSPTWFYREVSGRMLQKYNSIEVEIEDWNSVVFELVENIGYTHTLYE
jgi:hypothetical protein